MTTFEEQRAALFGIAYRMTGSAMDAEDIVQDAWIRYQNAKPAHPTAYLRKVVTNLSLDHLKSARVKREQYVGEWLPEPILTHTDSPLDTLSRTEYISMAFLVILQTLSPVERAVFILREIFDYSYDEIAQMLDRTPTACRQTFSRARKHIQEQRTRFDTSSDQHDSLVTQFIAALQTGDLDALTHLLTADATLHSDGGGKVQSATRPLYGRETLLTFLAGLQRRAQAAQIGYSLEAVVLNGETGMVGRLTTTGEIFIAASFESSNGQISVMRIIRNPDKLTTLQAL